MLQVTEFHDYIASVLTPNTAVKYRSAVMKFLDFLSRNGVRFDRMPVNILSLFSQFLVHQRLKPASVAVYVAGAKRFIEWSHRRGDTPMMVSASVDLPRITKMPPNALQQEHLIEYFKIAATLPEPKRSALLILPFCGLRMSELLSLAPASIKKVPVPIKSNGGRVTEFLCFEVRGKGGDTRVVPILPDGVSILIDYLKRWRRLIAGRGLWIYSDGRTINERTLRLEFVKIRKALGITRRFSAHTMRRTYITTLQKNGLDIATITKIAGHKSFQTTMDHYLEILPEDLVGAVASSGARLVERGAYADNANAAASKALNFLKNRRQT